MSVEIDGWTMLPIADAGSTTHIIATRDDDQGLTTDIDVVLYTKTPTGWDGFAYDPSVSKEDAMVDLATEFGLADPFGGTWQIDLDPTNATGAPAIPRQPFGKGFFVTDPLYLIANQLPDPTQLVQSAQAAGLPAGGGAINTGSFGGGTNAGGGQSTSCGCDNGCIQTMISIGADDYLIAAPQTQAEADQTLDHADLAMTGYAQSIFLCCRRRTATNFFDQGTWVCGAWTPTGPALPDLLAEGLWSCEYTRTSTRAQTRTRIRTCRNCTRCTWRENRTQTYTETYSEQFWSTDNPPVCPDPIAAPTCAAIIANPNATWVPVTTPCCP